MMPETEFHQVADATLRHCQDTLDAAYETGVIEDLELESGVLTITTTSGRTFVVSKHLPSRQLWLASPLSGGLHFSYQNSAWLLADGRNLYKVLAADLRASGVDTTL